MPTQIGKDTCSSCGYTFMDKDGDFKCPKCKSTARTKHAYFEGTLTFQTELEIISRGENFPSSWWIVNFVKRIKVGRAIGFRAKEELRFDRSVHDKTIKTHHVEELQPNGIWKIVHEEREECSAKKRPWFRK